MKRSDGRPPDLEALLSQRSGSIPTRNSAGELTIAPQQTLASRTFCRIHWLGGSVCTLRYQQAASIAVCTHYWNHEVICKSRQIWNQHPRVKSHDMEATHALSSNLRYPGPTLRALDLLQQEQFRKVILMPEVVNQMYEEGLAASEAPAKQS
ncbi:hypothetical protein ANO11243_028040 [Dothideomycetidae sp. 11243]|nr:hypothetical protein ANO11243_028040 [fungal sp. No.11243]